MKFVEEIRRERLRALVEEKGGLAGLNAALNRGSRDATLSQILHANVDSKTGRPREMGSKLARDIEKELKLPRGWMDNDPDLWPFASFTAERFAALPERQKGMAEQEVKRLLEEWEGALGGALRPAA
jgi:hypothetical protein